MAKKEQLRKIRAGTVINVKSKKQESSLAQAVQIVRSRIEEEFGIQLIHESKLAIKDMVAGIKSHFPGIDFQYFNDTSFLKPDGGILYFVVSEEIRCPILISEAKRQGTNDDRVKEGKGKQAQGNAVERLGKNVIGLRLWMAHEDIFPFVVFGQGVDFEKGSSILDRVATIAMFAPLNKIEVKSQGGPVKLNRGSYFFRAKPWTVEEMVKVLYKVARSALVHYQSTLN